MARHGEEEPEAEPLGAALLDLLQQPIRYLVTTWNWKAASLSALLRAAIFLLTNLHAGRHRAFRAGLVEACFAVVSAGVLAAITQRLRATKPRWATGLVVWLCLPALLVALQAAVHRMAGTLHLRAGLIASFCFAAFASGFNWFAQRRGAFLAGSGKNSGFADDLRALPRLLVEFLSGLPRALWSERRRSAPR